MKFQPNRSRWKDMPNFHRDMLNKLEYFGFALLHNSLEIENSVAAAAAYPRPVIGILVAMTVMKGTLDESGRPAM